VTATSGPTTPTSTVTPAQVSTALERGAPIAAPAQIAPQAEPGSVAPVNPPTTTTTSTTPSATGVSGEGQVTYYEHPAGTCASPWLPFGTVVRITNPANGASVTCVVNDREADTARSIDLATATFADIAPLWQGVIDAELSW
jgi:rare lipoprotein A